MRPSRLRARAGQHAADRAAPGAISRGGCARPVHGVARCLARADNRDLISLGTARLPLVCRSLPRPARARTDADGLPRREPLHFAAAPSGFGHGFDSRLREKSQCGGHDAAAGGGATRRTRHECAGRSRSVASYGELRPGIASHPRGHPGPSLSRQILCAQNPRRARAGPATGRPRPVAAEAAGRRTQPRGTSLAALRRDRAYAVSESALDEPRGPRGLAPDLLQCALRPDDRRGDAGRPGHRADARWHDPRSRGRRRR